MNFTAHNVQLDTGEFTMPNGSCVYFTERVEYAKNAIRAYFPGGYIGKKILDTGCLEGGYSVEFARLGLDVTGIEIHPDNFECCNYVKDHLSLSNLRFKQQNVLDINESYDIIFCCGLLYHLENPVTCLNLFKKTGASLIILQTHISENGGYTLEGYNGSWYQEPSTRWSSWKTSRSFWPTKEALCQMLTDIGFKVTQATKENGFNDRYFLTAYRI